MKDDIFVEGPYYNTTIPDSLLIERIIPPQVSDGLSGFAKAIGSTMNLVSMTMVPGTILMNLFL
jgi:hypothetical protein